MTAPTFADLLAGNRDALIYGAFLFVTLFAGLLLGWAIGRSRRDETVEALKGILAAASTLGPPLRALASGGTMIVGPGGHLMQRPRFSVRVEPAPAPAPSDPPMPKATPLPKPTGLLRDPGTGRLVSPDPGKAKAGRGRKGTKVGAV